jgi:RNA polymerase sigma-70 factor (ECF subfamily)
MPPSIDSSCKPGRGGFHTTRWSVVLSAGARGGSEAKGEALAILCETYWYPLYAFVRRAGRSAHDAQDLTQEFFARLIAKSWLHDVQPERGRFRSFLLAAMKHFLANEWDRACRLKRGGGQAVLSLDAALAEERYAQEPADTMSAEQIFDRRWAFTLLEKVLGRLRAEFAAIGKSSVFAELEPGLTGAKLEYAVIAARLNLNEGAVRVAVHRLRVRYRDLVRAEIAETVETEADIETELKHLFAALAR